MDYDTASLTAIELSDIMLTAGRRPRKSKQIQELVKSKLIARSATTGGTHAARTTRPARRGAKRRAAPRPASPPHRQAPRRPQQPAVPSRSAHPPAMMTSARLQSRVVNARDQAVDAVPALLATAVSPAGIAAMEQAQLADEAMPDEAVGPDDDATVAGEDSVDVAMDEPDGNQSRIEVLEARVRELRAAAAEQRRILLEQNYLVRALYSAGMAAANGLMDAQQQIDLGPAGH